MMTKTSSVSLFPPFEHRREMIWQSITVEARQASEDQPVMASFFHSNVLNHNSFEESISFYLASLLANKTVPAMTIQSIFKEALSKQPQIVDCMINDLLAHYTRDAACDQTLIPLLYFKGYHAIQSYRIAHWLWQQGRRQLAMYFQHRVNELFDVDIHPAAIIGSGVMLDHATGLVVGETAEIGDEVSILHNVTLGGSGTGGGDRHPKVGCGVLLSAGAKLLGNIVIGDSAKVGAGSLVLEDVPPRVTVAGVPAKQVGRTHGDKPSLDMNQSLDE